MIPHLLLRVVVLGIGLYAAYSGIVQFVYYLHTVLSLPSGWSEFSSYIFGYVVTPLMIAVACLGFSSAIVTFILGTRPEPTISSQNWNPEAVFSILLQVVGVYLFATTIGHAVATIFEFIAVKAGNTRFDEAQVMTDAIANGIALSAAFILTFNTKKVVAWIRTSSPRDSRSP